MSVLQEVSLLGSIHNSKKDVLIERLRALCSEDAKFHMMETAYKCPTTTTANETTYSELRARRTKIEGSQSANSSSQQTIDHTLSTVGVPHIDNSNPNQPVCVRGITEAAVWQNPTNFLRSVGYVQEFDFSKEGHMFLHPKNVLIYLFRVLRRTEVRTEVRVELRKELHPLFETSWLVEIVSVAKEMRLDEVRLVAKQLSQLVTFKAISQKDLYEEKQRREKEMMK
mmetsp:Transcript_369/g.624  ORF Transcript_369/g.624 Transcript_369/m.624 type:complete len:226 (-) Transcript_369:59-736(-)|eukprot:CAMPEP_0201530192 /NCGR_PEP_ID=MMETSP0161_2-20130828/43963_1 /ASSEMBLY_ACC=CAM_ASM_000251 /TAXON_ID=180227 /ORGANISM="Neoparamoeba aestuarina, Strain SoJaBio B1-5/56/2" /LENGTH=225 /DNA_ID=CAMNT_0047932417 /DNA_START=64 /DNA_END=741 /DNA_ORIENTATION=+